MLNGEIRLLLVGIAKTLERHSAERAAKKLRLRHLWGIASGRSQYAGRKTGSLMGLASVTPPSTDATPVVTNWLIDCPNGALLK